MRNVWIIGRHEYLTALLRPSFIIFTLLIPLLGLLSLGIAAFAGGQASTFIARVQPRHQYHRRRRFERGVHAPFAQI